MKADYDNKGFEEQTEMRREYILLIIKFQIQT